LPALPPSADARQTIDWSTRLISVREPVPAHMLAARAHMLADLRARIAGMKVDLQALVEHVRARGR
jgi:hypothetical protein